MPQTTSSLSDLVSALNDGIAFYNEASGRISNPVYTDVFARIRQHKASIVEKLNAEITKEAEQSESALKPSKKLHLKSDSTWLGSLRVNYADLVANFADHPRYSFVEQVDAQEARVLQAFTQAAGSDSSDATQAIAASYLPEIQQMYQEIQDLKALSAQQVNKI